MDELSEKLVMGDKFGEELGIEIGVEQSLADGVLKCGLGMGAENDNGFL